MHHVFSLEHFHLFARDGSTGIPVLDRAYKNVFAPMIHNGLSQLVEGVGYQNMSINMKRLFIKLYPKVMKK